MIDSIKEVLEKRWGPFTDTGNSISNGMPSYLNNGLKFNYLFKPVSKKRYKSYIMSNNLVIPPELQSLYTECNGFRLFLSSLSIYGIQNRQADMEPYDLVLENIKCNSHLYGALNNHLVFGAFGRDYIFTYDLSDLSSVKCIYIEDGNEVMSFSSISSLLNYFVPRTGDLYDADCKKESPNESFSGIPVLENMAYQIEEIM